jgi:methionyl-tRNA formyltransferase
VRIAFAGTPDFAVPALEALLGSRHVVVGVLTQPDRPAGRGREVQQSPVKRRALAAGLPLAEPPTLRTAEGRQALAEWAPDLLVVVAYGLILPREALALPRSGCLNIHASLLPRWRGAAPIQRAILAGDAETGVAIMRMEPGLDTGPVLRLARVPIGEHATGGELHDTLAALGARELLAALDDIERGAVAERAQPAEGVTYATKLEKAEALIDWRDSALAISRKVRAFNPWPVAETRCDGEPLRIHAARVLSPAPGAADGAAGRREPGFVRGLVDDALEVECGTGRLGITQLQRPGRRAIGAREFANATPLAGRVLG